MGFASACFSRAKRLTQAHFLLTPRIFRMHACSTRPSFPAEPFLLLLLLSSTSFISATLSFRRWETVGRGDKKKGGEAAPSEVPLPSNRLGQIWRPCCLLCRGTSEGIRCRIWMNYYGLLSNCDKVRLSPTTAAIHKRALFRPILFIYLFYFIKYKQLNLDTFADPDALDPICP